MIDSMEKVLEALGPHHEDISRSMEPPMRDLGVRVKSSSSVLHHAADHAIVGRRWCLTGRFF